MRAEAERERKSEWLGRKEHGGDRERERENAWRWRRRREEGQKASFVSSPSAAVLSSLFNMLFHLQPCRDKEREEQRGEEDNATDQQHLSK